MAKEWRKLVAYFQRYPMLALFSVQPIFSWKRKTKLYGKPLIAAHVFFRRARVPLSQSVKHSWKCWVITFCFPLYVEKVKNGEKFVGNKDNEYWQWCWILITFAAFSTYCHQRDLTLWLSSKNIRVSKRSIFFINFDRDLHFQGHLLHALYGQTVRPFWWKLDENRLNSVRDIQWFFSVFFHVTHFHV